jgi:hypothetical protein
MSDIIEQGQFPCGRPPRRSRWKLAIWLFLGAAVLVAIVAAAWYGIDVARSCTADAYVRCAFRPEAVFGEESAVPRAELEYDIFKNTQMSMMTNRLVLNTALYRETKVRDEKFVIAKFAMFADESDPIKYLTKKLSVSFPDKDEIMKISVTTYDPVQSAAIVTAVREAYMSEVVEAERREREERISELNGIKTAKQQEVKDMLTDLRKIADGLGTGDTDAISQKQRIILDELATVRGECRRNQSDFNRMVGDLAARKADRDAVESVPISDGEVQQEFPNDGILRELQFRLAEMQDAADQVRHTTAQNARSPNLAMSLGEYAKLQEKYNARLDQLKHDVMAKRKGIAEREVKKLEATIEIAKRQNEVAQEELNSLKKEADRIGTPSIDMQMRRAAITSAQKSLEQITAKLDKMNIEAKTAPRVTRYGGDPEPPKHAAPHF